MLRKRVLAATVMVSLFAAALMIDLYYFRDSILLHTIFLIGAYVSFHEFWGLCRATGHQTFSVWGTWSGCGLVAAHYVSMRLMTFSGNDVRAVQLALDLSMGALAVAILGSFLLTARRNKFEASLGGVAVTSLGLLYIYFLPSFILKLRHLGEDGLIGGQNWNIFGHKMVVATVVLAKGCDVWALVVGKALGRRKAFPNLSPGKTIEGVAAGIIGTVLTAVILSWDKIGILTQFALWKVCLIGLVIGVAGILGDLAESLLKRSAGAKDAGHVIPGYGGAMDVVDSLMVAGPVAYFLIAAII